MRPAALKGEVYRDGLPLDHASRSYGDVEKNTQRRDLRQARRRAQVSTGDRTILDSMSKRGNRYLRVFFVQAAFASTLDYAVP